MCKCIRYGVPIYICMYLIYPYNSILILTIRISLLMYICMHTYPYTNIGKEIL